MRRQILAWSYTTNCTHTQPYSYKQYIITPLQSGSEHESTLLANLQNSVGATITAMSMYRYCASAISLEICKLHYNSDQSAVLFLHRMIRVVPGVFLLTVQQLTLARISTATHSTQQAPKRVLNSEKDVASAQRPSRMSRGIHEMSCFFDVNGAATLASVLHRDTPVSAVFSAAQSLAPSPHMPTR